MATHDTNTRFEVVTEDDASTSYRSGYAAHLGKMMVRGPLGVIVSQFWRQPRQGQSTELSPMSSDTARKLAAALLSAADALDAAPAPKAEGAAGE